jgi:sulfofructose kinase
MARVFCVGHAVQDHIFRVDALPAQARKYQAKGFEIVGGGPAANAAVAIARLGGDAYLAARVGNDAIGDSIISDLASEGVNCNAVRRCKGVSSSLSSVFVDDNGERMIVNHRPKEMPTEPGWIDPIFPDDAHAVLADVRWPEGALYALRQAKDRNIPGILDADVPVPRDGALIAEASIVAFSADGLRDYTGVSDLAEALRKVGAETDAQCCVTCGANGVLVAESTNVRQAPAFPAKTVDTLGAGDIWHGAFALAVAEKFSIDDAVAFASAAAAIKVTRPGGRAGAPTRAEVLSLMNTRTNLETVE